MIDGRVTFIGVPSTRGDAWSPEAIKARGSINVRPPQDDIVYELEDVPPEDETDFPAS